MTIRNLFIFICFLAMSCKGQQSADLIVHNAIIYTVDSSFSTAEAMAVKDGKILAIGKNDAIMQSYTSNNMVDAKGQAIYPGFIDAHAHFVGYAGSLFQVDLYDSKSMEEMADRLKAFVGNHPG